jgi:hypothetical protein
MPANTWSSSTMSGGNSPGQDEVVRIESERRRATDCRRRFDVSHRCGHRTPPRWLRRVGNRCHVEWRQRIEHVVDESAFLPSFPSRRERWDHRRRARNSSTISPERITLYVVTVRVEAVMSAVVCAAVVQAVWRHEPVEDVLGRRLFGRE